MKKLIALIFCLAVFVPAVYAEFPKEMQAQTAQAVNNQLRVLTMKVWGADFPESVVTGKAVIVGFNANYTQMTVLASPSLSMDIDILGADIVLGSVSKGFVRPELPTMLTIESYNPDVNKHYYKLTFAVSLKGTNLHNAKQFKRIPLSEATKLL